MVGRSWPEVSTQLWRYVSDRTGIISFANFPIIWIFGMRNNLLMWLTGWDFATYNNFHRWIARVATLQAVVHSIGYTVLVFKSTSGCLVLSTSIHPRPNQRLLFRWRVALLRRVLGTNVLVGRRAGKFVTDLSFPASCLFPIALTINQATICMCLLLGLSVFWMRRNSYEAFLVIHIVLSILILVLMLG